MDGMPVRTWTGERADFVAAPFDPPMDRACAVPCADWLDALPQAAAILRMDGDVPTVEQANDLLLTAFPAFKQSGGADLFGAETKWVERIAEFHASKGKSDSFEIRRDGKLGPEFFACTVGRLPSPNRLLFTAIDRSSERQTERNLRRELLSDSLTALPNRTGFGEEIDDRLANGHWPSECGYAVLAIDLVRFSRINESLGALAGDELIITVAKRLKSSLRQGDVLARIGGNEFAVFARLNNGLSDALHIVQRINDSLSSPIRLSNLQIGVDCAIGCSLSNTLGDDPDDIVRQAQSSVKVAKRTGKLEIYRVGALKEAHHRFKMESRLREALANGGLTLAFQPLVHLRTGEVTGFEALARWIDPELGEVMPTEFIPVAEESGLIVPLGRWALYEAIQTLARWDLMHGEALPVGVNVNLSAIQMARDDVPSIVEEALRFGGISGKRLTIELTESAIVADPEKARHVLGALKGLDVSIAMDDFGTGFSNLASLQSLPIDSLKIDRSFVSGMLMDRDKDAIVRAVLSLADSLDLNVTAEGIETQALAQTLQKLRCWQGQGYYFAQAMPEQEAFDYWRARWNFETI
ncbi:MAG: putative bifunctional diguanylate cyclase/phosphodiesterase [Sphingobium phenoxybenzoativorans]